MAGAKTHFIAIFVLLGLLAVLDFAGAQIGVCYGRNGNGLPSPQDVVALYNRNNISRMRIYEPHQPTLQALRGSNIELILGVQNTDLQSLASNQANANNWVQNNVRNYSDVRFRYIAVGNEVSPVGATSQYVQFVLPAMRNIFNAISAAGLAKKIKVSTAVETGLVTNSYPPSRGEFRGDVRGYINPIIEFLEKNGSPLLVNMHPYFAYINNPRNISLDYALFRSGVDTPDGRYGSLFDAFLDATYSAVEKAGGSSVNIVVSESGWPSAGGTAASNGNARTYNQNLIRHVLGTERTPKRPGSSIGSYIFAMFDEDQKNPGNEGTGYALFCYDCNVLGTGGTPKRPGRSIETYIFAIFDEDQKNPEFEKHFGLFLPNGIPKYQISFT